MGMLPQTIHLSASVGDRVTVVKIAALGKPLEIHDTDEMGGYNPPAPYPGDSDGRPAERRAAAGTSSTANFAQAGRGSAVGARQSSVPNY